MIGLLILSLAQTPKFDLPESAALAGVSLDLPGVGFGNPGTGSFLEIQYGGNSFRLPSTDPKVLEWRDDLIQLDVPDDARSGRIRVHTPLGISPFLKVDVFEYQWFDIPPTPGTNASPLAITVGPDHRVWVNQEFHLDFQMLDPAVGSVTGLPIPKPPNPGPFASTIFSDHRTQTSSLGEDILVDPQGRVWFSQGGGYLYSGAHPNHSRVVCYDPAAPAGTEYRVYNLPGDWNEAIGLAWDSARGRMWVTNGGLTSGAKIASFDPEQLPWDNHFAFDVSLKNQICRPGNPISDCWQVFELPNPTSQPAHLLVHPNGDIWYTAYWGNAIGRLKPETGLIEEFPLPAAIGTAPPVWVVGSGPWQILLGPNDDVFFCEFFDSTVGRFRISRLGDPACLQLNAQGRNPCIGEIVVPDVDLEHHQMHSIAFDGEGRLWFTQHTGRDQLDSTATLGFVTADGAAMVLLPSLAEFDLDDAPSAAGIAIDPVTQDIWFSEFWRQRIGLFKRVP
ncbi:MAG: hypothetical protein DWQ01_00850 [Planctomycetota bacterium]|nr:MAG: hypothetical protein DWQ01_00850 [Planctomycetota bacterium]